jgi:hypothetical protein
MVLKTLAEAKAKLPKFAKGLAEGKTTVEEVRDAVRFELRACFAGQNPLEPKQVKALQEFLGNHSSPSIFVFGSNINRK